MKPLKLIKDTEISGVQFVCSDIDDTMTQDGRLGSEAYSALWRLADAGYRVIPVTGRPAGWCDLIARQWPVDAVIGENGAFAFYMEGGHLRHLYHPGADRDGAQEKLTAIKDAVLAVVPDARVAKDQFCRVFDLAIDFREEPPDLGYEAGNRIADICRAQGAHAKVSSIHVNTWFGDYTKVDMVSCYLSSRYSLDKASQKSRVIYCGDSPNDEPMFEFFPLSCGVSNIEPMMHLIDHKPGFVTSESHGRGFAELAERLLRVKLYQ